MTDEQRLTTRPRCWQCGQLLDGFAGVNQDGHIDHAIRPHDEHADRQSVSICAYCCALGMYVSSVYGLTIRRPTPAEGAELEADEHVQHTLAAARLLQRRLLQRRQR